MKKGQSYVQFLFVSHLQYSRWASTCSVTNPTYCNVAILPVVSNDLSPSLLGSRIRFFYRDASLALLLLVNQSLNTYSPSHAFLYRSYTLYTIKDLIY